MVEPVPIHAEDPLSLFESLSERLGWKDHAVLLEGREGGWFDGRFSLLAGDPFGLFQSKGKESRFDYFGGGKRETFSQNGDPLKHLQEWLDRFHNEKKSSPDFPSLQGAAIGFFSYDLIRQWERIPPPRHTNPTLPDIYLPFFNLFALFDHRQEVLHLVYDPAPLITMGESEASTLKEGKRKITALKESLLSPVSPKGGRPNPVSPEILSDLPRERYIKQVLQIKEYISAGDIFQANLSHRFRISSPSLSLLSIYKRLRKINPSPFSAYLELGAIQIASNSPERLVRITSREGRRIVDTRPIAGTRPRGKNKSEEEEMVRSLSSNEKERAEHLMLVDLERNDLGKVCRYGSIRVGPLMSLEKYSHVIHLVSNIEGELRPDIKCVDVIKALFPGGTITGVPKIRCMEILSELEREARGIYTGSIGYLGFGGEIDLNIAIRTWIRQGEEMTFRVGAGIVADSDPEKEYQETLQKAAALINAGGGVSGHPLQAVEEGL